jgi:hypothetical protein
MVLMLAAGLQLAGGSQAKGDVSVKVDALVNFQTERTINSPYQITSPVFVPPSPEWAFAVAGTFPGDTHVLVAKNSLDGVYLISKLTDTERAVQVCVTWDLELDAANYRMAMDGRLRSLAPSRGGGGGAAVARQPIWMAEEGGSNAFGANDPAATSALLNSAGSAVTAALTGSAPAGEEALQGGLMAVDFSGPLSGTSTAQGSLTLLSGSMTITDPLLITPVTGTNGISQEGTYSVSVPTP